MRGEEERRGEAAGEERNVKPSTGLQWLVTRPGLVCQTEIIIFSQLSATTPCCSPALLHYHRFYTGSLTQKNRQSY